MLAAILPHWANQNRSLHPSLLPQATSWGFGPLPSNDVPPTLVTQGLSARNAVVGFGASFVDLISVKSLAPWSPEAAKNVIPCLVVAFCNRVFHLCSSCCPAWLFSVASDAPQLFEMMLPR